MRAWLGDYSPVPSPKRKRKKAPGPRVRSSLEQKFVDQALALRLPAWAEEHYFAKPRRWRFDFAWPDRMLAVEIEGGTHSGGRHTRGSGYAADCEKYNAAAIQGWHVLRFTSDHLREVLGDSPAMVQLRRAIEQFSENP